MSVRYTREITLDTHSEHFAGAYARMHGEEINPDAPDFTKRAVVAHAITHAIGYATQWGFLESHIAHVEIWLQYDGEISAAYRAHKPGECPENTHRCVHSIFYQCAIPRAHAGPDGTPGYDWHS